MDTKIKTVQQSKISYEKNTVPIAVPHMLNAMGSSNRNDNGGIVISADVRFSGKMSRTSMNANLSGSNDGLSKDTHCVNLPLRVNTVFPRSDALSDIGWNRLHRRRTNSARGGWTARVLLSMERSSSVAKESLSWWMLNVIHCSLDPIMSRRNPEIYTRSSVLLLSGGYH